MLNFTVGPVMSPSEVLEVSAKSAPYFRTPEFSQVMLENERIMLGLLSAPKDSRCVFLTSSGTGAMEAAVMSVLAPAERVAVVNGGSFGQRFVDLCQLHGHPVDEIKLEFGHQITRKNLEDAVDLSCGALLVNMHETSSGLLYDMSLLSGFCRELRDGPDRRRRERVHRRGDRHDFPRSRRGADRIAKGPLVPSGYFAHGTVATRAEEGSGQP